MRADTNSDPDTYSDRYGDTNIDRYADFNSNRDTAGDTGPNTDAEPNPGNTDTITNAEPECNGNTDDAGHQPVDSDARSDGG